MKRIINKKTKYIKFNYSNYTVRVNGKVYTFDAWALKRKKTKRELKYPMMFMSASELLPRDFKLLIPGSILPFSRNNIGYLIKNAVA